MNYITTTQLRTKSPDLVNLLLAGESINLVHRSKIIGEIRAKTESENKLFCAENMREIAQKLNLPKLTPAQREKNYREAMIQKHGKSLS